MKRKVFLALVIANLFCSAFADVTPTSNYVSPLITVVSHIQALNYPIVKSIELKDGIYKVTAVNRLGQEVNMEVDPTTLNIIKPSEPNTMQVSILDAISAVIANGYHGIYKIQSTSNGYSVEALDKAGNNVSLTIDGINGKVSKDWF